ncbi:MAG: polymerase family protein with 3-5-exonuclease and polymerase domain, partial [Nocardioides sp.]|nr:polymerase family protein with 3-5-exonuclease and polymerase domain [Nocardioides sp.]
MTRVSLSRLPGDRVLVVDEDVERELAVADLPAYVGVREVDAPRWVWDDTARWYPPLLAAGVRVERCHDLRLGHHLLRRAPAVDGRLLDGEESEHWDRLGPSAPSHPALFSIDDTAEHLRADLEDARQLAAVAASPEAARLGLLLAAESSGALVAAEMTYAGVPWRVDV